MDIHTHTAGFSFVHPSMHTEREWGLHMHSSKYQFSAALHSMLPLYTVLSIYSGMGTFHLTLGRLIVHWDLFFFFFFFRLLQFNDFSFEWTTISRLNLWLPLDSVFTVTFSVLWDPSSTSPLGLQGAIMIQIDSCWWPSRTANALSCSVHWSTLHRPRSKCE